MRLLLNIFSVILFANLTHALKCYTCQMNGGETDRNCENNPALVTTSPPTTNCNKKYCNIIRMEYIDSHEIYSFYRGCSDTPQNGVEVNSYRTYFSSCTTTLCNKGDGKSGGGSGGGGSGSGGDGNGIIDDGSDGNILIVPGIGESQIIVPLSLLIILLMTLVVFI